MCERCQKLTKTIGGKCPNCWYVKDPSVVPPRRKYKPSGVDPPVGLSDRSNIANGVSSILEGLLNAWPW
jgi:hypothetical protein